MGKYIFIFWFFAVLPAYAQKEANIWYFGDMAGVDFGQGKPVALADGVLSTQEGVATISDKNGKLLFYTDGVTVYNAQHKIMPNGKGLKGHESTTQSAVILPKVGSPTQYYLFTLAMQANKDGFCYSIVDMGLENGLGDIVSNQKNIQLRNSVTEKLTAVKHRNGKDAWAIVHEWNSNKFLAYLITAKGIDATPVESAVGSTHEGALPNTQGYMKANTDGTNIALAMPQTVEVFDFDNSTGKVSNPISLALPPKHGAYGIEFSPNNAFLYVSSPLKSIFQYNLQNTRSIDSSRVEVVKRNDGFGALQLAPDGKIYVALPQKNFLGCIQFPDKLGTDCKYQHNALPLKGKSLAGLPTFMQSFFEPKLSSSITYFDKNKVKIGEKMVLRNVQFDYGLAELKPAYLTDLNDLAEYMQKYPQTRLKLSGHTDNIGNKPSNIILSQNRVKAIKDYLVGKKIAETRISFEGFGSSVPIFTNDSEEHRAKNRRVEIEIFDK